MEHLSIKELEELVEEVLCKSHSHLLDNLFDGEKG